MELIWSYIKKVSTGMVDEKVTVISSFSTIKRKTELERDVIEQE